MKSVAKSLGALLLAVAVAPPQFLRAQEAAEAPTFKTEELDQLLAPIALYPDDLLTNVLVASTYPLEVVQAARWKKEPANAKLKGDALAKVLELKDWDPSVKVLVQIPDVLQQMSDKLEWTQKLGDAFLAQQQDVMDRIQFLRQKADSTGALKTNEQQRVTKQDSYIVIEPASPEVVYVPVYQPTVVYGPWWYPAYPPYYWYWGRPASAFVSGFFWGTGFAVANSLWGWGHCDWGRHDIDIDVNKWNNINVNRTQITANKWEHNPTHRGAVPYKSKDVRDKYKGADLGPAASKEFRGHDKADLDRSQIEAKLKDTDHSQIKDKVGNGAGEKIRDKAGDGAGANVKDKVGDRSKGGAEKISRDIDRPAAKKPAPGAFDVKSGGDVRKNADRGKASRTAMSQGGGGGGPRGGGGGNRGGGGRRR